MAATNTVCPHCGSEDPAPIPDTNYRIVDHSTNPHRGGSKWDRTTCKNCGKKYGVKYGKA